MQAGDRRNIADNGCEPAFRLLYACETFYNTSDIKTFLTTILNDPTPSGDFFKAYCEVLTGVARLNYRSDEDRGFINRRLTTLLKQLFFNALEHHHIEYYDIQMELCVAGSLARGEATPYSDIDCFLIYGNDVTAEQKSQIQKVLNAVTWLTRAMFEHTNQFMMDPIGISLSQMNGTTKELLAIVNEKNEAAIDVSILNSISVTGQCHLLDALKAAVALKHSDLDFFRDAIFNYAGPDFDAKVINLKRDILRPLDFMLQGFRSIAQLSAQDYISQDRLLSELVAQKIISTAVANTIRYLKKEAYLIRQGLHEQHKGEYEKVDNNFYIRRMLELVSLLRGSLLTLLGVKYADGVKPDMTAKVRLPKRKTPFDLDPGSYLTNNQLCKTKTSELIALEQAEKIVFRLDQFARKHNKANLFRFVGVIWDHVESMKANVAADRDACLNFFAEAMLFSLEAEKNRTKPSAETRGSWQEFFRSNNADALEWMKLLEQSMMDIIQFKEAHLTKTAPTPPPSPLLRK